MEIVGFTLILGKSGYEIIAFALVSVLNIMEIVGFTLVLGKSVYVIIVFVKVSVTDTMEIIVLHWV